MVLLADPGEQLERGTAVLVAVLHADLGERPGHRVGADPAVGGRDRAEATLRGPRLAVGLGRAAAAEQTGAGQLLDADGEAHVALAGLDRHDRRAQRGRARGARVGDVVDGDPGLADLLLQPLTHPGVGLHQATGREHADVAHRHPAVGEGGHRRFGREVDRVLVGVLAELRHLDAEDPDVVTGHGGSPSEFVEFAESEFVASLGSSYGLEAVADGLDTVVVGAE